MRTFVYNKCNELKIEIEIDFLRKSRWIYLKMQSLLELVNNELIDELNIEEEEISNFSNIMITKYIVDRYSSDRSIFQNLYLVNQFSNILKHSSEGSRLKDVVFDLKIIESFFKDYNTYCHNFFDSRSNFFFFDHESLIQKSKKEVVEKSINKEKNEYHTKAKIQTDFDNVNQIKSKDNAKCVFISNGFGHGDYGFEIYGLNMDQNCTHEDASVYAVVYSILRRNSRINKPLYIKKQEKLIGYDVNYRNVYKYIMIILNMIRFNYLEENELLVKCNDGEQLSLELAMGTINWYGQIIMGLRGKDFVPIILKFSDDSSLNVNTISIFPDKKSSIYCLDSEKQQMIRDYWYANSIIYSADKNSTNIESLLLLLNELFNYDSFKSGQMNVLFKMLQSNDRQIVMLPTGGGKSLLYYFIALLQPNPTIIVSPTNSLIKDQIRNLIELHNIDDCIGYFSGKTSLRYKDLHIDQFSLNHKFIFITPEVFHHKKMLKDIIKSNLSKKISNVILDEVHYISNWSHNFRPDYLMLSHNLTTYLNQIRYIGFTATASYRVLDDIIMQLGINNDNIIVPIELKRENIEYSFIKYNDEAALKNIFKSDVKNLLNSKRDQERSIIYVSPDMVNNNMLVELEREQIYFIDILKEGQPHSYEGFVSGNKSILISNGEMGIGINVPMVKNVIHLSLPVSKGQYVQELGRLERFSGYGISKIYFKPYSLMTDLERKILNFDTSFEDLINLLNQLEEDNQLKKVYKKIMRPLDVRFEIEKIVLDLYDRIRTSKEIKFSIEFQETVEQAVFSQQISFYFLTLIGALSNWSIIHHGETLIIYEIESMKMDFIDYQRSVIRYVRKVEYSEEIVYRIENATTINDMVSCLLDWYQHKFVQYHREQFLNLIDFFNIHSDKNVDLISGQLAEFFNSPLIKYSDETVQDITTMQFNRIVDLVSEHIALNNTQFIAHIEKMIEDEYNIKYDYYFYLYNKYLSNYINLSRIERIVMNLEGSTMFDFLNSVNYIYPNKSSNEDKLRVINILKKKFNINDILNQIFKSIDKDLVYYGYLLNSVNTTLQTINEGGVTIE